MANQGNLEGIACPKCGENERLDVVATVHATVVDSGVADAVDYGWDDESETHCTDCGFTGKWADFIIDKKEN